MFIDFPQFLRIMQMSRQKVASIEALNDDNLSKKFAERLNRALDVRNYPPIGRGRISYLQEVFTLSRAGANKWLHGKAIPQPKRRSEIAEKLGVSLRWLETGNGDMFEREELSYSADKRVHKIPLLTMRQAYILDKGIDLSKEEFLVVSHDIPNNSVAIKNIGSAMEPRFHDGDILIMNPIAVIQDGDCVIAKTAILPEVVFRQYVQGSEHAYLVAFNSKFETIHIDSNIHILGKIVETRNFL